MKKPVGIALSILISGGALVWPAASPGDAAASGPDAIITGTVSDSGSPEKAVDVVAIAWPNSETMAGLAKGDVVPNALIDRVTTDAAGRFEVDMPAGGLPAIYRGPDGGLDVQLLVADTTRELHFNVTVTGADDARRAANDADAAVPQIAFDLAQGTAVEKGADPASWVKNNGTPLGTRSASVLRHTLVRRPTRFMQKFLSMPASALRPSSVASAAAAARRGAEPGLRLDTCHNYTGDSHNGRPEKFVNVYAWAGAKATVTERNGTDHTVGIGTTNSSSGANLQQNGTKTVSSSASASQVAVNAALFNKVNYADFYNSCYPGFDRRPVSMNALLSSANQVAHTNFTGCTTYSPGATLTKTTGTNSTYALGVDIIGVSVSAQSGWDRDTEIRWDVTQRTKACGSTSSGWVSSPQAETRAP